MDIKDQINEWLKGTQDYQEGLKLLLKVSKKRRMVAKLMTWKVRDTSSRLYIRYHEKLVYELSRFIIPIEIPVPGTEEPELKDSETIEDLNSIKANPGIITKARLDEIKRQSFIRSQLNFY